MSRRADTIRNLIAVSAEEALSADNASPNVARVTSGSVRSVKQIFTDVELENQMLKEQLAQAAVIRDIAPDLIDPSPYRDRFDDYDRGAYEALLQSMSEKGQEVPVLLRPHPQHSGRYQSAFGHRRIRAAAELRVPVRANVKDLTDDRLAVAQGIENSAREDLTFIERAFFALRLEESGQGRDVVRQALAIDRAEASKLLTVAKAITSTLALAIGRAPKIGRPRWLELAELLGEPEARRRVTMIVERPRFAEASSDERFLEVLAAAAPRTNKPLRSGASATFTSPNGAKLASVRRSDRSVTIEFHQKAAPGFAEFVEGKLAKLFEEFASADPHNSSHKETVRQ